jgi:hypothetical protein
MFCSIRIKRQYVFLIHFNLRYIGMTPDTSSTGHSAEETDTIGLRTVKKELFLDDTAAEAAGGRIIGGIFGHSGLEMATPDVPMLLL